MRSRKLTAPPDVNEEVFALIETIRDTGQRLEELTGGQVDTVVDRDGRAFLLRGTQEQMRDAEAARQVLVLNALPARVALLDATGVIVSVNESWKSFGHANAASAPVGGIGSNYLEICDGVPEEESAEHHLVADGIRSVLTGRAKSFSLKYQFRAAADELWFLLRVTPLSNDGPYGAVVMHLNITEQKRAEDELHNSERRRAAESDARTRNAELEVRVAQRTKALEEQTAILAQQAAMLDLAQDSIIVRDTNSRILYWNRASELMYGWTSEYAVGKISETLLRSEFTQTFDELMVTLIERGHWEGEGVHHTRTGKRISVNTRCALQRDVTGAPAQILTITNDITTRRLAESQLRASSERLSLATSVANVGVWDWDLASNTVTWDDTMFRMYGFAHVGPIPYQRWSGAVHPDDLPEVEAILQRVIREKSQDTAEFRIIATSGEVRTISAAERAVVNENCEVVRVIGVNMDITERKAAEKLLQRSEAHSTHSAQHDFLTGLPNRMLLNDRVSQAVTVAPRHGKKVAVLFLDLDGFKHINDSLGHSVGDKLLQSVAGRLVDCVRASDTVSRMGGDEFVVLLSEMAHSEDASITARRMLQKVAEAHSIDHHELYVTASIGVSVHPDDGIDAETLIKNADTAMYQAKENGRQGYQFFKSAMNVRAVERQLTEEKLRRALERREFEIYYQPKINLDTNRITGAEALLRWQHPTRGILLPAQFISVAEDSGLMLPIGKWVLRRACQQARAWQDAGLPLRTIAVNISSIQFRDDQFVKNVFDVLHDSGLDARSLELELTESALMKRADCATRVLKTLRAGGVRVALDDFGTGYSSLSFLKRFPIDVLKIDESFIREIVRSPNDMSIVAAVIGLGKSLRVRVVAEGVELPEELAFLRSHECDEAQGFYFSGPLAAKQFSDLLKTGFRETNRPDDGSLRMQL